MVAGDQDNGQVAKGRCGPLHGACLGPDVARQDDDIGIGVHRLEWLEFVVQVGEDEEFHGQFDFAGDRVSPLN